MAKRNFVGYQNYLLDILEKRLEINSPNQKQAHDSITQSKHPHLKMILSVCLCMCVCKCVCDPNVLACILEITMEDVFELV